MLLLLTVSNESTAIRFCLHARVSMVRSIQGHTALLVSTVTLNYSSKKIGSDYIPRQITFHLEHFAFIDEILSATSHEGGGFVAALSPSPLPGQSLPKFTKLKVVL